MGLYRLHKTVWEQQVRSITEAYREKMGLPAMNNGPIGKGKDKEGDEEVANAGRSGKRKRNADGDDGEATGAGRFEDEGGLLHPAESEERHKKRNKKKKGEEGKGISSGVTEIIRHKDGTREVRGGKGTGAGGAGGGGAGNWWEDNAGA
jgi:RNA exonuclease 4